MANLAKIYQTGKLTVSGSTFGMTNITFEKTIDKINVSDTNTAVGSVDYLYTSQINRTFSGELWLPSSGTLPVFATACSMSLDFEGRTVNGMGVIESATYDAKLNNAISFKLKGQFTGAVTES